MVSTCPDLEVSKSLIHEKLIDEVLDLHRFIEAWLNGSLPKTKEVFSRFDCVLASDFMIVHPSGELDNRDQILEGFWSAYGTRDDLIIEIRNPAFRFSCQSFAVLTYEEWQMGRTTSARFSTVIFRVSKECSEIKWRHLHETWIAL